MLQVIIFISLESVERYFGGQLAAWKRMHKKPRIVLFYFKYSLALKKSLEMNQKYSSGYFHIRGGDPRVRHQRQTHKTA